MPTAGRSSRALSRTMPACRSWAESARSPSSAEVPHRLPPTRTPAASRPSADAPGWWGASALMRVATCRRSSQGASATRKRVQRRMQGCACMPTPCGGTGSPTISPATSAFRSGTTNETASSAFATSSANARCFTPAPATRGSSAIPSTGSPGRERPAATSTTTGSPIS